MALIDCPLISPRFARLSRALPAIVRIAFDLIPLAEPCEGEACRSRAIRPSTVWLQACLLRIDRPEERARPARPRGRLCWGPRIGGLSIGAGASHGGRRNGKFAILAYIRPMNRPLPLIAGLLGVLFLAVAAMYWFVPASGLPSFFPGFKAGSDHIAVKHAIGSLVIALVLFAFAWLQSRRGARGARI